MSVRSIELRIRSLKSRVIRQVYRSLLLVIACWLIRGGFVNAQTGPGGIGNSSSNILWLKADAITGLSNGQRVQTWPDESGNGNDVSQSSSSRRPYYYTNILNGFPVVDFSSVNLHYLNGSLGGNLSSPFTILAVTQFNNDYFYSYAINIGNGNELSNVSISRDYRSSHTSYYCWTGGSGYSSEFYDSPANSLPTGSTNIINAVHTSTGSHQLFLNGITQAISPPSIGSLNCPATINVGRKLEGSIGSNFMEGYISEIIIYNRQLNIAERFIVENYLAAKYGLSISASGHDFYKYDATHYYDVAGIGMEDASNSNVEAMSSKILQIGSASSLDNGDYLLFGHQNGSISTWTNLNTPSTDIYIVPRNWRFDERGDIGTVTALVDFASLPAIPGDWSCTNRYLIIDSDGNFSSGSTVHELTHVAGSLFSVSDLSIGDGDYVTIGIGEGEAPIASAGVDQSICGSLTATLSGNAPSHGSGLWTVVTQPAGSSVTFSNSGSPLSTVTVSHYGSYTFRWTLTGTGGSGCSTRDDVQVGFTESASAGVDQSICGSLTATLSGNTPSHGSGLWTVVTRPAGSSVTFSNSGSPLSTVTVSHYGLYTFRWTLTGTGGSGCSTRDDVEVWFEPKPSITAVSDTICNDTFTNITPVSSTTTVRYGLRYTWTVEDVDNIINGEASSEGNGMPLGESIIQQLNNPDNVAHKVIYHIRPWTIMSDGSLHCAGDEISIEIWVEPTVVITAASDTICDGEATSIVVSSINSTTRGIRYTWTVTDNPAVEGASSSTGQGQLIGTPIVQTLNNTSDDYQVVQYTITPWTIDNDGNNKCSGSPFTVDIWVEPTARVISTISNDTICNNQQITYSLSTPTNAIFGVTYNVEVINNYSEITGYTQLRHNLPDISIDETLNNSGDTARMIMYVISPAITDINGIQKCQGINDTIRVWVNPTPRAVPRNISPAICYGGTTQIILESPTVMTKGDIVYDYSVTTTGGSSIGGDFTSMTDLVNGHTIARSYTNKADTIYSVYFSIIPRNNIMSCVSGDTSLHQVRIHPHPLDTMFLSTPFTCSGGNEGIITAVLSRGSKPDSIYWHRPSFLGDTAYVTSENSTDLNIRYAGYYWVTVYDSLKCSYNWSDYNPLAKAFVSGTTFVTNLSVAGYPTGYDVTCPGASDGIIRIMEDVSSTATPPFEFWLVLNDADTVLNDIIWTKGSIYYANNMAAGQYRLIMRDMNNCYNEPNPITVTEPENISVTFGKKVFEGGYNVSCKGYSDGQVWVSSVTGGNPGGYKYKWYTYDGLITGPDTLDRLDNVSAGTYYLLTTDRYCTKVDSVTLIQPEGMNMAEFNLSYTSDSLFNISCNGGNDGSIDITITGGSGNYTYFWTDSALFSATTRNISNLSAGTYVCEIKDVNGCILRLQPSSALPAFTLTEPAPLDITSVLSASPAGPFNIGCNGGTGSIDISVTGGSEGLYQFKWSASEGGSGIVDGEEDQFSLTAGRYHLEVEDLYGCIAVYDTILTEPDEISTVVVTTNITCGAVGLDNGSIELSVTGGVAPYTYFWTDSVSFSSTDKDISNLGEGTYYVTITDANGCVYIDSAHIELPPAITFTTTLSDRNGYNVSCYGRSDGAIDISLTSGLAPYVFNWSGPDGFTASTGDISGLKAGEYILSITDVNLCSAYDTIILTEPGRLGIDVTLSSSFAGDYQINCAGSSTGSIEVVPVNQAGAVTYLWSDGNTSSLRTGLPEGIYELIITDSNGCHADTTLQLTAPDSIKIEFNITQPLCPDMPDGSIELAVTGGVPGADYNYRWSDNSVNKDLSGIVSGLYSVVVSDMNGCIARDSVFVEPIQELCLIIPNAISPNGDLINDYWNIGLKELYPEIEVKIFNRWGEEIWRSAKGYPDPWDGRSKGSLLPIDSYHYIIDLHNGTKPIMGTVTIVR